MEERAFSEFFMDSSSEYSGSDLEEDEDSETDFEPDVEAQVIEEQITEEQDNASDSDSTNFSFSARGMIESSQRFQWRNEQGDPFQPTAAEFAEPVTTVCNEDLTSSSTPFEILRTLITDEMMEEVALQTNEFASTIQAARPSALKRWVPVTVAELWQFFGVLLLMGVVKLPWIKDYWSTRKILNVPIFGEIISRNRFEDILRALHFCDNARTNFQEDRFRKLGSFLPDLLQNFVTAINPSEFLCVDESLVPFKGRVAFRQYNPMKRARFGIKLINLVDCSTKFLLKVIPYQGKTTQLDPQFGVAEYGFGGAAVCTLLKDLTGKSHRVVVDNWFNGPNLARHLHTHSTYLLGTVRKNRKGMPKFGRKLKKGEVEAFTDGRILVERWHHRREVVMLNSFLEHEMRAAPVRPNSRGTPELKPQSVLVYNKMMGAVDSIDQQVKPYECIRKSMKWYKKMALHFLDLAVHNSYALNNVIRPTTDRKKYKEYLLALIEEIFNTFPVPRKTLGRPSVQSLDASRVSRQHLPGIRKNRNGKKVRRECAYHNLIGPRKRLTAEYCMSCNKHLCIGGEDSCFVKYHTDNVLPKKRRRVENNVSNEDEGEETNFSMELSSQESISLLANCA